MVIEAALSILKEKVWDPYMELEEKIGTLKRKMEVLMSRQDDVTAETKNVELHSSKKRRREVDNWQSAVLNLEHEFNCFDQEVHQSSNHSRIQLSHRADKIHKEVEDLLEQGKFSDGIFLNVNEQKGHPLVTTNLKGQMFDKSLRDVLVSLSEVSSIGICGMGGVGKTTLAVHIHDHLLKDSRVLGNVYWVTVSQDFSITKMQNDIAKAVGLDLSSENDDKKRTAKLFQSLKRKKSFVLILDDVWTHFDVKTVGIPLEIGSGKLIITSRSVDVCDKIGCQKNVKVETLSPIESWELFLETLDHRGDLPAEIEEIAKKMTKKCDGLPLGLITMAASMRGVNDVFEWRDAFEEFTESCMQMEYMNDKVFPILRYSYNRLRDPRLQKCFLYCCLFPEDDRISRDGLIRLFIVEELMGKRHSRRAEFDQGHAILNKLEKACLLESADGERCVRMHDLVREMALKIGRDEFKWMVKAGAQLREIPGEQEWFEDLDKVSLRDNDIMEISVPLSYGHPRLTTLTLLGNHRLSQIVDPFFAQMTGLRVLDLSFTAIEKLPSSVSNLEKLSALLLRCCHHLRFVPPLDKLKSLIELDLCNTNIEEVPQGLESLENLRFLDMRVDRTYSSKRSLKKPDIDLFARLSNLQSLLLAPFGVRQEELQGMRQLEVFHGRFIDACSFNRFVKYRESCGKPSFFAIFLHLKYFSKPMIMFASRPIYFSEEIITALESNLFVKQVILYYVVLGGENVETLCYEQLEEEEGRDVILPLDTQVLVIQFCEFHSSANNFLDAIPSLHQSKDLRRIIIGRCSGMEFLLRLSMSNSMGERMMGIHGLTSTFNPFQSLEELHLQFLEEFIGLVKLELGEPLPPVGTFSNLQYLCVSECHKIKKLIPRWLLQYLVNLMEIRVLECKEMEDIITDDEEEEVNQCAISASSSSSIISSSKSKIKNNDEVVLTKLQVLHLYKLPKLKSIYKGRMTCGSIKRICLRGCPKLKRLPLALPLRNERPSAPPVLQEIKMDELEWESLEWDHPQYENVLRPFLKFY